MSLYKQFATDHDAEVDGAWFSYPQPDGSVIELLLARAGGSNTPYKRDLRRLLRKHTRAGDTPIEQYPPALNDVCQAIADHILKGWRTRYPDGKTVEKIQDEGGSMVGYTAERAKKVLADLPDLRQDVLARSADYRNFQDINAEELE